MTEDWRDWERDWEDWERNRKTPGSHIVCQGQIVTLSCPSCGSQSDYMSNWHQGEASDRHNEASAWRCWKCNELHPEIAYLREAKAKYEALLRIWLAHGPDYQSGAWTVAEETRAILDGLPDDDMSTQESQ